MNIEIFRVRAWEELWFAGLTQHGWKFEYDRATRRFGCCKYTPKLITMSKILVELNPFDKCMNTLKHEIAHAFTPGHHHDKVWREVALNIGCDGNVYYDSANTQLPNPKWVGTCPVCGEQRFRLKRAAVSCGECSTFYDPTKLLIWEPYVPTT